MRAKCKTHHKAAKYLCSVCGPLCDKEEDSNASHNGIQISETISNLINIATKLFEVKQTIRNYYRSRSLIIGEKMYDPYLRGLYSNIFKQQQLQALLLKSYQSKHYLMQIIDNEIKKQYISMRLYIKEIAEVVKTNKGCGKYECNIIQSYITNNNDEAASFTECHECLVKYICNKLKIPVEIIQPSVGVIFNLDSIWESLYFVEMSRKYINQKKYNDAVQILHKAEVYTRNYFGDYTIKLAEVLSLIGEAYDKAGKLGDALKFYEESVSICYAVVGAHHSYIAHSHFSIGFTYSRINQSKEAIYHFFKSIAVYDILGERDTENRAEVCYELGLEYYACSDYLNALIYDVEALNIRKKIFGENHLKVADSYANAASSYSAQSNSRNAKEFTMAAIKIRSNILGPNAAGIAMLWFNLSNDCHVEKNYNESNTNLLKCIEIANINSEYIWLCKAYTQLGNNYYDLEKFSDAIQYFTNGLEFEKYVNNKADKKFIASAFSHNGLSHIKCNQISEGIALLKQGINRDVVLYSEDHPLVANSYYIIGATMVNNKQYAESAQYLEKSLSIRIKIKSDPSDIAKVYYSLGFMYFSLEKDELANMYFNEFLNIETKLPNKNIENIVLSYIYIGDTYNNTSPYTKALYYYQQALLFEISSPQKTDIVMVNIYIKLAEVYYHMRLVAESSNHFSLATDILFKSKSYSHLCKVYETQILPFFRGIPEFLVQHLTKYKTYLEQIYGSNHPTTLSISKQLASAKTNMSQLAA